MLKPVMRVRTSIARVTATALACWSAAPAAFAQVVNGAFHGTSGGGAYGNGTVFAVRR